MKKVIETHIGVLSSSNIYILYKDEDGKCYRSNGAFIFEISILEYEMILLLKKEGE